MLKGKTIALGVTGSIAAYKAVNIASRLTQSGARVDVIMTKAATEFVTPLTFQAITGRPVVTEMFNLSSEFSIEHISLAEADVIVIAPATANIIAKLAAGIADDMLCCTVLASKAPVIVAPAMDANMFENPVTQDNLSKLKARGFITVGPASGRLASGKEGLGRLADATDIIGTICQVLGKNGDLAGKDIVVTAGGTQEPIDPVRCITNRSSGKMGYALAEAARDRGAKVTLITAPTWLVKPIGMKIIDVCTAQEIHQAVGEVVSQADVLIMAAAVADYRPVRKLDEKMKRKDTGLTLELERTPDILGSIKGDFIKVGFAAESSNLVENAKQKLQQKGLHLIVANDITASDSGFGADNNQVTIIDREGKIDGLPLLPKREVADKILDRVDQLLATQEPRGVKGTEQFEIPLAKSWIKGHRVNLPITEEGLFPLPGVQIVVQTDIGRLRAIVKNHGDRPHIHLKDWFNRHRDLKPIDKLIIEVIKPMAEYHLRVTGE